MTILVNGERAKSEGVFLDEETKRMNDLCRFKLGFWGVRGSTPTPKIEYLSFGGNTPCIELRTIENEILVLDAGTGISPLGAALVEEAKGPLNIKVFITHFHWDHIQGIPFFLPLYFPDNKVTFFSFENRAEKMLKGQMMEPYFPVNLDLLPARLEFQAIEHRLVKISGLQISPFPMNHPQGATGYRIEKEGIAVVYASDHEHGDKEMDEIIRENSSDASVLIYDAQYTPEEYQDRLGWGHSNWLEATRLAHDSRVGKLVLFHHDPSHEDSKMTDIVFEARKHFPWVKAACEGEFLSF